MSTKVSVFVVWVFLAAFSFGSTGLMAEEILITKDGIHLGWVTSKDKFMTCHKTIMEIDEGAVEEIADRCPSFEKIPLVRGSVDSVDASNQVLWLKDEGGQIQKLFFFETAEEHGKTHLKGLEKGNKVIVTVPIPGRVGSIQAEE